MKNLLLGVVVSSFLFFSAQTFAQSQHYQVVHNHTTDTSIPPTVYVQPDAALQSQCTTCSFTTYRLVRQLNCGTVVAIEDILEGKPTCRMVPRVSTGGAIELQWDTTNSHIAFIDGGTGHVSLGTGGRIVTPTTNTTYNMTVVSTDGLVGVCSARVNVSDAKSAGTELLVLRDNEQGQAERGDVVDTGIYEYNEGVVYKKALSSAQEQDAEQYRQVQKIAHTATMSANRPFTKATSFFSSGIFLIIALLLLFILALWLIFKHGVR